MKKITTYIFCVFCVFALIACQTEEYKEESNTAYLIEALEIGGAADSADGGNHNSEYEPWSAENTGIFQFENVLKEIAVTFNNVDYRGEYYRSEKNIPVNYQVDFYSVGGVKFGVNSETKELVCFFKDGNGGTLSEKECIAIAERFAAKHIDIDDYTITFNENSKSYSFYFQKTIYNIPTCECLAISVSTEGEIIYFEKQMIDAFDDLSLSETELTSRVKELQSEQAMQVLDQKVDSIYDKYTSYEVVSQCVVILDDGSVGIKYDLSVSHRLEYSTDEFIETSSLFSVVLK